MDFFNVPIREKVVSFFDEVAQLLPKKVGV